VSIKKRGTKKLRVCIDFRDLNRATPKDEYHMSIADILINDASRHKVISFLDGNTGYNQILWLKRMFPKRFYMSRFCWFIWMACYDFSFKMPTLLIKGL
jgi:hypothetical protein